MNVKDALIMDLRNKCEDELESKFEFIAWACFDYANCKISAVPYSQINIEEEMEEYVWMKEAYTFLMENVNDYDIESINRLLEKNRLLERLGRTRR